MSDLEIRQFSGRAAKPNAGAGRKMSGQAAPFNSQTLIGGAFREQIDPRAWNKTLVDGDQVLLDNHNQAKPLARRSAGTLELHAGHGGVLWSAEASNTSYANDVLENVRAGNYGGCSFSFQVTKGGDKWEEDTPDGIPLRTLMDIKVREISVVTFPQYDDTSVQARSQVETAMEYRSRFWSAIMEGDVYRDTADGDGPGPVSHEGKKKPYGDVEYADPKNGKYPIDTAEHVHAALSYINMPKNAAKYPLNGVTISEVKARIHAAAKKFGIKVAGDTQSNAAEDNDTYRLYEGDEFTLRTKVDYTDSEWSALQDELKWLGKSHLISEPDSSTRGLNKEEAALFTQRTQEMRRAIFESRKASFQK